MSQQSVDHDPDFPGPEASSSFGDLLSQFEKSHSTKRTEEARDGTIVAISAESAFVDVGLKIEGILPLTELREKDGTLAAKPGDKLRVAITGRDTEGYYLLSKISVARPKDWSSLEKAFAEKRAIAGVVSAAVKGGLSVDVGVRAFMPASRSGTRDAAELEKLIGQEISCKIIKLDVADEDLVVDRRVVLEEQEKQDREKKIATLQEGMTVHGTVRSVTDFGAFVDIGGVDGLLHVTDMSWGRVNKPSDLVSVGDAIDVRILKMEGASEGKKSRRISLGLKQLQADPWDLAAAKFKAGDRVKGVVTRTADFGAFVELEPGVEGLIHISEMSWGKKIHKPSDVVKPGDSVEIVVLGVNPADRRISLGLKQALGDPWAEAEKRFAAGTVVEGPITSLTKFGAFVQLDESLEGMIHVSDISAEKRVNHPQEVFKTGQVVRAAVLEVDREKRRIRLGLKQLQPTSLDEYIAEHKAGDLVTGRVSKVSQGKVVVELGEGIHASCSVSAADAGESTATPARADLSALTSMLNAKWKSGAASAKAEPAHAGQIRSFRILKLDAAQKKIELEIAS
jgi:small subunit ribosomal protein S1